MTASRRTRPRSLRQLFEPRSIAIVGASGDVRKTGGRPLLYLTQHGFDGDIYLVNPRRAEIHGRKCYPTLAAIGRPVDLALILSPAADVPDVLEQGVACGVRNFIVFASGFAEQDQAGIARQAHIAELARASDVNVLGPNCVGIMNSEFRLCSTIASIGEVVQFRKGSASLVSQSGAISGYWLDKLEHAGLGFSKWISSGNEADIDMADCLEYLATDASTDTINLYVESIRDPVRFANAILLARQFGKRVIALLAGRSEAGVAAVTSHTAAWLPMRM